MNLRDLLSITLKRLRSRFLESFIIILAIGLAIGVISSVISLRISTQQELQSILSPEESRKIRVETFGDFLPMGEVIMRRGTRKPARDAEMTLNDFYEIKETIEIFDYVYTSRNFTMEIETDGENGEVDTIRTTPDYFSYNNLNIINGRLFTDNDVKDGNKVAILGENKAEELFDDNPVGQQLNTKDGQIFDIIGVLSSEQNNNYSDKIIVPYKVSGERNEVFVVSMIVNKGDELKSAESQISNFMENRFGSGYRIRTPLDRLNLEETRKFENVISFAGSLALILAVINILNLMLGRVLRRADDIGITKALGSSKKDIFLLQLIEALLMGILGGVLGILFGFFGEIFFAIGFRHMTFTFNIYVYLIAVGISGFVSLVFGIYPALQAANINPARVLRNE